MNTDRDASIVECHYLGLGHAQIARDFGLTRERVRQIVKRQVGCSTPLKQQPAVRRSMALQALHQLEVGRSSQEVAQQWGLSGEQLEKILQEQIGLSRQTAAFQGWMAQQLGCHFNHWVVLAIGPEHSGSLSQMRCRVAARCNRCGTVHRLGYRNLASGASTMCHRCSCQTRRQGQPVQDLLSGASYPSLKSAASAQGLSYGQAQYWLRHPSSARFKRLPNSGPTPAPGAH
jgi:DNA-binding phage protein